MKRILVPIDFSDASKEAYRLALGFAEAFGADVEVLHVWSLPVMAASGDVLIALPDQPYQSASKWVESSAQQEMDALIAENPPPPGVEVTRRLESGRAEETIIACADDCDLIVMGTHGRTGLSHLFLGSVAERVIRLAPCPVITVKS